MNIGNIIVRLARISSAWDLKLNKTNIDRSRKNFHASSLRYNNWNWRVRDMPLHRMSIILESTGTHFSISHHKIRNIYKRLSNLWRSVTSKHIQHFHFINYQYFDFIVSNHFYQWNGIISRRVNSIWSACSNTQWLFIIIINYYQRFIIELE